VLALLFWGLIYNLTVNPRRNNPLYPCGFYEISGGGL